MASSVQQFAELGKDLTFVIAHEEPLPFTLINPSGRTITFPTKEQPTGQGYYIESSKKSDVWIFVIHEWWGLNDYVKNEAEKLHASFPDANILCLDMYDGKIATTREDAGKFMQEAKETRLLDIIDGASAYCGSDAKIATIGWCFGGGWSSKSTVVLGKKMFASVIYYGMPVLDEEQLKNIQCPTLGIFAEQDGWITPAKAKEFEQKLLKNNKSIVNHIYPAAHAFANPSNPKYDKVNADDAWQKTIAFLTTNYPK
jgi:carboxymethylenebutenolidase